MIEIIFLFFFFLLLLLQALLLIVWIVAVFALLASEHSILVPPDSAVSSTRAGPPGLHAPSESSRKVKPSANFERTVWPWFYFSAELNLKTKKSKFQRIFLEFHLFSISPIFLLFIFSTNNQTIISPRKITMIQSYFSHFFSEKNPKKIRKLKFQTLW